MTIERTHPHTTERRFILSIAITSVIFIAELLGGFWTGSLALLSDSAHVFLDIFALGLSYLALRLSSLPPDDRHTFGYHRLEVLAALANGLTLAVISIGIFYESYKRWMAPEPVKSGEMLVIAAIGLVANLVVAFVLGRDDHGHTVHEHKDLNVQSAFLHVLGDAISSVGVILAAIVISFSGWLWVDPLVSILIGVIILAGSGRVLRSSIHILIEGTPEGISVVRIGESLKRVPGVEGVHDLHVWNICSGTTALSAHLVVSAEVNRDSGGTISTIRDLLSKQYGIDHSTVQFECIACGQEHLVHH
jgi:cobalt-zinc-cadmium efflux system protein